MVWHAGWAIAFFFLGKNERNFMATEILCNSLTLLPFPPLIGSHSYQEMK